MRIDAIIQAVRYADMLAITLPLNKVSFDSVTVWTAPDDEAVKQVCADNGVPCHETDAFYINGSSFNRGAAYNVAFWELFQRCGTSPHSTDGWVCQLDSDIVMPQGWRAAFEALPPDPQCFYGARRYDIQTQEDWERVKADPEYLKTLTLYRGYGYGYWQCWNPGSWTFGSRWFHTGGRPHPEYPDGSTADWMWRNLWGDAPWDPPTQPPDHALDHSVPEPCDPPTGLLRKAPFHVQHLGIPGVNATGRHTPLWTP